VGLVQKANFSPCTSYDHIPSSEVFKVENWQSLSVYLLSKVGSFTTLKLVMLNHSLVLHLDDPPLQHPPTFSLRGGAREGGREGGTEGGMRDRNAVSF
jgi:hypothetical protein